MRPRTVESLEEIHSVLSNPDWRVRPPGNEIPAGLNGSLAGDIFSSFARMSDGDDHRRRREMVNELISTLGENAIPAIVQNILRRLEPVTPHDLQYQMPGMVITSLLGVPESEQRLVVEQVRLLVIAARPGACVEDHQGAIAAIEKVVPLIMAGVEEVNFNDIEIIASRISLIFQTSDACAAMVGNALVTLASLIDTRDVNGADVVQASMQIRVPIRNTSRFRNDEAVVIDLESAHHKEPHQDWTFGFGPHSCPGRSIATSIAIACIEAVIARPPFDLSSIRNVGWEDLPNAWIPKLAWKEECSQ